MIYWKVVASHSLVTPEVLHYQYDGSGSIEDPYNVEFIPRDPRNPLGFSMFKKWTITVLIAFATLAVSFASSAYSGGVAEIMQEFKCSEEVATLGVSLFVLGFAIGPLLWAPLSEIYGRRKLSFRIISAPNPLTSSAAHLDSICSEDILRTSQEEFLTLK